LSWATSLTQRAPVGPTAIQGSAVFKKPQRHRFLPSRQQGTSIGSSPRDHSRRLRQRVPQHAMHGLLPDRLMDQLRKGLPAPAAGWMFSIALGLAFDRMDLESSLQQSHPNGALPTNAGRWPPGAASGRSQVGRRGPDAAPGRSRFRRAKPGQAGGPARQRSRAVMAGMLSPEAVAEAPHGEWICCSGSGGWPQAFPVTSGYGHPPFWCLTT